jgi:hypothetical protein
LNAATVIPFTMLTFSSISSSAGLRIRILFPFSSSLVACVPRRAGASEKSLRHITGWIFFLQSKFGPQRGIERSCVVQLQ